MTDTSNSAENPQEEQNFDHHNFIELVKRINSLDNRVFGLEMKGEEIVIEDRFR